MTNTIRIKKRASGGASGALSSLAPSELAYSEVDNILSYGFGDAGGGAARLCHFNRRFWSVCDSYQRPDLKR